MSRVHVREDQQSRTKCQRDREVTGSRGGGSRSSCNTHNQQKKKKKKKLVATQPGCYNLQMNYPSPKEQRAQRAHCGAGIIYESFLGNIADAI